MNEQAQTNADAIKQTIYQFIADITGVDRLALLSGRITDQQYRRFQEVLNAVVAEARSRDGRDGP